MLAARVAADGLFVAAGGILGTLEDRTPLPWAVACGAGPFASPGIVMDLFAIPRSIYRRVLYLRRRQSEGEVNGFRVRTRG